MANIPTISLRSTPIPPSHFAPQSPQSTLDDYLTSFLSTWSLLSTLLLLLTLTILLYPLFFSKDPDTHPFLLARQSQPAPIRQPGESAVYRALDVPHGYPLRASLGVKDVGAPKWSPGRVGDLRDVWRTAALGALGEDGGNDGKVGRFLVVKGREGVEEVVMGDVTGMINGLGTWMKSKGKGKEKKVAVCLPNSVEALGCVFASAFHTFPLTLLPSTLTPETTTSLLKQTKAEVLIAEAGTLPVNALPPSIKNVILVTKGGSKHMDWSDDSPNGVTVSMWDEVVAGGSTEVLPVDKETKVGPISLYSEGEMVEFTSTNIISGIAGLLATVARQNKLTSSDILLPTSSLTDSYALCWTLAALYLNASIALNSVAGENVDLALCTAGVQPTVIIAAPATVEAYVTDTLKSGTGPGMVGRYFARSSLRGGVMPTKRPTVALSSLSKVRLVLIGQSASEKQRLPSSTLHQLRLILGAKVAYALTAPWVAGAVSQTNLHDYRDKGGIVGVGPPLGSVEVHMSGEEEKLGSATPEGKLVVKGPPVNGGKVQLDVAVQIDTDHTLKLL